MLFFNDSKRRIIVINKMFDGNVSEIRKSLLHIVKFLAKEVTDLAPKSPRDADYDFGKGILQLSTSTI